MSHMLAASVLAMSRLTLPLLLLLPALAAATGARGETAATKSPWLEALSSAFVVLDLAEGDIDGDGKNESVLCYQDNPDNPYSAGGVAILGEKGGHLRPLFHVRLDQTWCEKVQIRGRQVGMLLRSTTRDKTGGQLVWTYGKEIHWQGTAGHFLTGAKVSASSSLAGGSNGPAGALDGDLRTSWAEGASGTGIGETLTIKLPAPMDVAYVALYGGHPGGLNAFLEHNRVHRASIEARTTADLGDPVAGIDFSELGIDVGGDRIELVLENRPQVTYVKVDKKDVSELELRIDSVYLGRTHDDTHVAEIEIVPRLSLHETLDRARPLSARRPAAKPAAKPEATDTAKAAEATDEGAEPDELTEPASARSEVADKALEALDGSGRGLDLSVDEL